MTRSGTGIRVVAKSAILWLTLGVVLASVYGALLSAQPIHRDLIVPTAEPVLASSGENYTN
jgi:hypothetical protein